MDRNRLHAVLSLVGLNVLLLVFLFAVLIEDANALGRWRFLGGKTVHGRIDRDTIMVTKYKGPLRSLKFTVKGSALELHKIVVTFRNNRKFSPNTRLLFKKGSWSRTIDLPGKDRLVKRVDFYYRNLPRGGKARIKLYGH